MNWSQFYIEAYTNHQNKRVSFKSDVQESLLLLDTEPSLVWKDTSSTFVWKDSNHNHKSRMANNDVSKRIRLKAQ
jgi:hypothetical protein